MFPSRGSHLLALALMPPVMVGGLAVGLALASHRAAALTALVAVLVAGAYLRRFGPVGFVSGIVAFIGDFFGFTLNGKLDFSALGWLAVEATLGVAVAAITQFGLFNPNPRSALRRTVRSMSSRSRRVSADALALFDAPPADRTRRERRLHRRLTELNEAALIFDALLGAPSDLPRDVSAVRVHQVLIDAELAVTNLARFTRALADAPLPPALRGHIRAALVAATDGELVQAEAEARAILAALHRDFPTVAGVGGQDGPIAVDDPLLIARRFAVSVLDYARFVQEWRVLGSPDAGSTGAPDPTSDPFTSPVVLAAGSLPGAALASAAASEEAGPGLQGGVRLAPHLRVAIQMAVAVTGAVLLGDLLSGQRFYWAVIAAFVTFFGANNTGEQLRKGLNRIIGTLAGVLLGAVSAHLVGRDSGVAIAVILVLLFFGLYLMRISYVFMVIAITIIVSQLYVQLNEFSNSLLALRLEETAIGAGVAIVTVLCVVPLHYGRVLGIAMREFVTAVGHVTTEAHVRLREGGDGRELRAAVRQLDSAFHALAATATPRRTPVLTELTGALLATSRDTHRLIRAAYATRIHARNLLPGTDRPLGHVARVADDLDRAVRLLNESLSELRSATEDSSPAKHTYIRSASLFERVAADLDLFGSEFVFEPTTGLALLDFQQLDGSLARLAEAYGMDIRALDTTS
jgi:uncharacterized membrane protein YccC